MKRIAIAKVAGTDGIIRGRTFEDCEIIGPATLIAAGVDNNFIDCEVPFADKMVYATTGRRDVVLLVGCTLRRCRFAQDVDTAQLLLNELTGGPE